MTCQRGRKLEIYFIMGQVDFFNFQKASPRKCSGHLPTNSTQLKYDIVLQPGRVSAFVPISIPLAMTCEHGRKIEISIMW